MFRRDHVRFETGGVRAAFPVAAWSMVFERLRQGQPIVEEDIMATVATSEEQAALASIGIRSCVAITLIQQSRLIGAITMCHAQPRRWQPDEVWLVQEVGECTWAAVERTRAASALRDSEERFRKLTNSVPAFVWLAAPDGSVTFVSDHGRKIQGLTIEEARGDGWKNALHPDDIERASAAWTDSCERGTTYEIEVRYWQKDGVCRWQLARAEPLRSEAGVITSWFGSSTDFDDMRRLQEHQKLLLAELQHRVRNTLAAVRSIAQRTATTSESIDSFAANFEGRLDAFARTQAVVTRDPSKG